MRFLIVLCVCNVAEAKTSIALSSEQDSCGVEASTNPIHQNPWLVLLEFYRRGIRFDKRCGGSLIDEKHIVTAAHCVRRAKTKNSRLYARLGEYDISKQIDCIDQVCAHLPVKIEVASISLHPLYDGKEHDIAILTLKHRAPYTDTIRPICLPSGKIHKNVTFQASGWGEIFSRGVYSDIKKKLTLPYWSSDICQKSFRTQLPEHIICAGGQQGVDTCRGDSGGPLVWVKDRSELWGVTSSGSTICGTKGVPGIYVNVEEHLDWMKGIIQKRLLKDD